jgi:hypothetical protein
MAILTVTNKRKIPLGKDWMVMCRVSLTGTNNADYIPAATLGLTRIRGAFGTMMASALAPEIPTLNINAQTNAAAEGSSMGDLSVMSFTGNYVADIWVIGRGRRSLK